MRTKVARTKTTNNGNGNSHDGWLSLVLQTMSVDELQRESINEDNSASERASMIAELRKRGAL